MTARRQGPARVLLLLLIGAPLSAAAQEPQATSDSGVQAAAAERSSQTRGAVTIDGRSVDYIATVGDILLRDDEGKPAASMTYVSYVRDGLKPEARRARPVTFAFNGGPGSASVWVHLGAFGPRRALLDDEGWPTGPPPGKLIDNEYSVLDVTDLVLIDPVATGWSRAIGSEEVDGTEAERDFTGFTKDVEHIGDFIRLWLSRNDRWASPKFLAGESYGTTRASGLARFLQDRHGMYLNGICLISSVINWGTKVFNIGNDLPHVLILPSFTASAWYHGKLPDRYDGDLQSALRDAEGFALGDYATALLKGDRLQGDERKRIARHLAELTGLSEAYVESADLRIEIHRFAKQLLRDEGKTVGRLDSRYVGADRDDADQRFEFDPAMTVMTSHYVSLLKDYLRHDLGYASDVEFRHSAGSRVRPWNYHEDTRTEGYNTNGYANYAEHLREAMHKNPALQVLVMSGYYDLATPYFASDYTVDHMQLDPALRDNVRIAYYEAGHMMYVRVPDLRKFREDFLALIDAAGSADATRTRRRADVEP